MSEVAIFSNPARRRRRRKNTAKRRRRNPARHAAQGYTVGTKRIRRRKMNPIRHRRHRNPIMGGEIGATLLPAAIGAAGALGINILLSYVTFLPVSLQSGYGRAGVQIAAGLAVGAFGPKVGLSRKTAYAVASGISLIALYDVVSTLVASKFPNVNLGEQFSMLPSALATPGHAIAGYGEQFQLPPSTANNHAPGNTFG